MGRIMRRQGPGRAATLAGLLALAGFACGGPSGAVTDEGREAATRFLDEVRAGRVDPAWQGTSTEFKSYMGLDSLRDYVKLHPALGGPAEFVEGHPIASGRGPAVVYTYKATAPPRAKARGKAAAKPVEAVAVMMFREDGAWKVERLTAE